MNEQKRVFVAIDISDEARQRIAAYIGDLRRRSGGDAIKFERSEKLHITLQFLGDIDPDRLARVISSVGAIANGHRPFEFEVSGTGIFPNAANPRILWLGITGDEIPSIAAEFNEAFEPLGFAAEKRSFSPHLTIARVRQGGHARNTVNRHLEQRFVPVRTKVSSLSVYQSRLLRTGSVYSLVSNHDLLPGPSSELTFVPNTFRPLL